MKLSVLIALAGVIAACFALLFWQDDEDVVDGLPIDEAKKKVLFYKITPKQAHEIATNRWQLLMREMPDDEKAFSGYPDPVPGFLFEDEGKYKGKYIFPAGAFRKHGWGYRSGYIVDAVDGKVVWDRRLFCRPENIVYLDE